MSTAMSKLRVGVVGVGHLGRHHARILAAHPEVELVAVADARLEQARAVAESCGTRAVDDYRALLDCVDAVSIAAPTVVHHEVATAFLDRGIAAMVEKPLAARIDEAEEIVELARRRGVVLQVGHIERFNPVLAALDAFPIRPRFINAERLSTHTFRSTDIGIVHDLMIHDLDLVLSMFSAPVRTVSAVGVAVFGGFEDVAEARLEFEDGAVATLAASRASFQASRKMRIWGADGYVALDFAAKRATIVRPSARLRAGHLDLEGVSLAQPAEVKAHLFGKVLETESFQGDGPEPLALELDEFVQSVLGRATPRVDGDAALRALLVADRIVRGLRSHVWSKSGETVPPPPHIGTARAAARAARSALERDDSVTRD